MRFTIITYIEHKKKENYFYSYAPYIREMNIWLDQVSEVEVVAPLSNGLVKTAELAYAHRKVFFKEIPGTNLLSGRSAFHALVNMPQTFLKIYNAMKRSDHIHLRCPGNTGLIGCILQMFFPKKTKTTKYAGNWDPKAKQPWSYNLQKWILRNTFLTRNMQVLVYGEWPKQTRNIIPFFTASFSEKEKPQVQGKNFDGQLTFLFVGNLVAGKHPVKAVQLVQKIDLEMNKGTSQKARTIKLHIYGNGPEKEMLKAYCKNENLIDLVEFKGNRPLEDLKLAYQQAHFVILPSQSEGWPKAVAEAMFFGCIPIATPVSCVPWMLNFGSRGILLSGTEKRNRGVRYFETEDSGQRTKTSKEEPDVQKILNILKEPEEMSRMSEAAKEWSQQYTLEKFEDAVKEVIASQPPIGD